MPLPSSGAISFNNINVELGLTATAQISLNDSAVRTLFGVSSGAISMSQGYGKSNAFAFTISTNTTDGNLRTLAIAAGWNQSSAVTATVASGVYLFSTSTSTPGLTVNGSWPGGIALVNNGFIIGRGGNGGNGGPPDGIVLSVGGNGGAGGLALQVASAVSITNNGTIGGGGGGGGGGAGWSEGYAFQAGGGGGGGRANGTGGTGGPYGPDPEYSGASGTLLSAGAGGLFGGATGGGNGGDLGAAGSSGSREASFNTPGSGGAAGAAVSGNSLITWVAFGTRLGAIA
jgi:hypothetical protein